MAIAAWLVWRPAGFVAATPMVLFAVQLVLNIAATTATFFRSLPVAGWLMTPYLIWVTSAVVLNFTIWGMSF